MKLSMSMMTNSTMILLITTLLLLSQLPLTQCQQQHQQTNPTINNFINNEYTTQKFPYTKFIWVYWDNNIQQAPLIVQLCLYKMKLVSEQQNWQLIVLNDNNLHQYITNYDTEFISVKKRMQHPQWKAGVADLVRLSVLSEHGGVWFDLSTILIHGLKWLSNLQRIPYLLTNSQLDQGQQPDLLVPYLNFYQSLSQQRDQQTGKLTKLLPGYQAWFIAAKKNTSIISQWKRRYIQHITTKSSANRQHEIQNQYYTKSLKGEYLNVDKSINQIVQDRQKQIDMELGLFEQRKNANKQLNIVGFHGEYGPFILYLKLIPDLDMAFTHTLEQLQDQFYITVNFFVKFTNQQRGHFDDKIKKLIKLFNGDYNGNRYKSFEQFIKSKPSYDQCKQVKFIVQGSIFGRLIKHNKLAQSYNLYPISKQQQYIWLSYCQNLSISSTKASQKDNTNNHNNYNNNNRYSQQQQAKIRNQSNIQNFLNWLYVRDIISKQTRSQIIKYFEDISWMGIMSIDLKELYYWKRVYGNGDGDYMGDNNNGLVKQQQRQELQQKDDGDDFEIEIINGKDDSKNNNNNNKNNNNKKSQLTNLNLNLHSQQQQQQSQQRLLTNKNDNNNKNNNQWPSLPMNKKTHYYIQLILAKLQPVIVKFWYLLKDFKPYIYQLMPIIVYGFLLIYLVLLLVKFRLRYIKYLWRIACYVLMRKQQSYLKDDQNTEIVWLKIKQIFIKFKQQNKLILIIKILSKLTIFITTLIGHFIFGLIFTTFQIIVILKFIRICLDGDIHNQQLPLLTIILIQIAFRHIIYSIINKKAYFIPGIISMKLLYRMFLPIYYACFGRCLVMFGQKRQEWNFGLGFTVCLVFPIIVKEIELKARKIVKKYNNSNKNDKYIKNNKNIKNIKKQQSKSKSKQQSNSQSILQLLSIIMNKLSITTISILSNITNILQILVIEFLLLTYLLPNILYMYSGKQHFLQLLIKRLAFNYGGIVLVVVLIMLYMVEIVGMFGQLVRQYKSIVVYKRLDQLTTYSLNSNNADDNNNQTVEQFQQQTQQRQQIQQKPQQQLYQQSQPSYKNNSPTQHPSQHPTQCHFQPSIIPHFITFITTITKYSLNIQLFYKLAIQPYPQMVYNNVQQIWKPRMSQVLMLIVINFEMEKVVDQLCYKVSYYFKSDINNANTNKSNNKMYWLNNSIKWFKRMVKGQKLSHNQLQQQQQQMQVIDIIDHNNFNNNINNNINNTYYQQNPLTLPSQPSQPPNNFLNNNNCYIPIISLYIFQLFRLQMFQHIFMYFEVINKKRFDLRWQVQKQFPLFKQEIIYYTFAGYCLLVFVEMFIEQNGSRMKGYFIKRSNKSNKSNKQSVSLIRVQKQWGEKQMVRITNYNDSKNNKNIIKSNKKPVNKQIKSEQQNTIRQQQLSSYELNKQFTINNDI